MLKVKKNHKNHKNKAQEDDITQLQNDIKNSIKNLYISDQKTKKTINDYAELLTKIRNEYAKLQQECNQLKIQLQKYKDYVEQIPQRYYQKPLRKRKHYSLLMKKVKKVILTSQKLGKKGQKNKQKEE